MEREEREVEDRTVGGEMKKRSREGKDRQIYTEHESGDGVNGGM